MITQIEVVDEATYSKYQARVPDICAKYGGKHLVRGTELESSEGGWRPQRAAVVEFPSIERAKRFHDSLDHQTVLRMRLKSTESQMMMTKGVQ